MPTRTTAEGWTCSSLGTRPAFEVVMCQKNLGTISGERTNICVDHPCGRKERQRRPQDDRPCCPPSIRHVLQLLLEYWGCRRDGGDNGWRLNVAGRPDLLLVLARDLLLLVTVGHGAKGFLRSAMNGAWGVCTDGCRKTRGLEGESDFVRRPARERYRSPPELGLKPSPTFSRICSCLC